MMQQKFIIQPNAWTDANKLPTDDLGNQHNSGMSMYAYRRTGNWLPGSYLVYYPSTNVSDPMASATNGNITAQLEHPMGFPMIETTNQVPVQFHSSQESYEPQEYFTQGNHLQPSSIKHPLYEQTVEYPRGSRGDSTDNWRKPLWFPQPSDLNRDVSCSHGSDNQQHVLVKKKIRWPRLIYGSSCTRDLNTPFWGEKRGRGKKTSYNKGLKSSRMFMPTHYPLSPYKKRLSKSKRKALHKHKIPSSRKTCKTGFVLQMLKACAKKGQEASETDGYKKRLKQHLSISHIKQMLLEELFTKFKLANSMEFSQNGSDEDSIQVRVEGDKQAVNIKTPMWNPNGWVMMNLDPGVEHGSSGSIKPVKPPLPQEHDLKVITEKNPKLLQSPRTFAFVVKQNQKKDRLTGVENLSPVTIVEEQDVFPIQSDMSYPKKLTPAASFDPYEANTLVTKAKVVSTNASIQAPLPSKIVNLKRTLKPTVPPWFPPRSSNTRSLPLLIKPVVNDNPLQTVKKHEHRIKPDVTSNTPEAEPIHVPQASEQQIQSKQKKKPQIRRRKKVIDKEICEDQQKFPLKKKEEPSTQDQSKRRSGCAFVMDCLLRMSTFTRLREKL